MNKTTKRERKEKWAVYNMDEKEICFKIWVLKQDNLRRGDMIEISKSETYIQLIRENMLNAEKEINELVSSLKYLFGKVERGYKIKKRICVHCNMEFEEDNEEFEDCLEEELWGHIQSMHEVIFEEVQDLDTPYMLEECYAQLS
jgi:hypothetical protein